MGAAEIRISGRISRPTGKINIYKSQRMGTDSGLGDKVIQIFFLTEFMETFFSLLSVEFLPIRYKRLK